MLKKLARPTSLFLVFSFILLNFMVPHAQAKMVETHVVLAEQRAELQRAQIEDFLVREDVQQILTQNGVDPIEAQQRINSLSNQELTEIASSIDQLPAGGSTAGAIVSAGLLIFFVLFITDLLGLTHVYPFVNHQR